MKKLSSFIKINKCRNPILIYITLFTREIFLQVCIKPGELYLKIHFLISFRYFSDKVKYIVIVLDILQPKCLELKFSSSLPRLRHLLEVTGNL